MGHTAFFEHTHNAFGIAIGNFLAARHGITDLQTVVAFVILFDAGINFESIFDFHITVFVDLTVQFVVFEVALIIDSPAVPTAFELITFETGPIFLFIHAADAKDPVVNIADQFAVVHGLSRHNGFVAAELIGKVARILIGITGSGNLFAAVVFRQRPNRRFFRFGRFLFINTSRIFGFAIGAVCFVICGGKLFVDTVGQFNAVNTAAVQIIDNLAHHLHGHFVNVILTEIYLAVADDKTGRKACISHNNRQAGLPFFIGGNHGLRVFPRIIVRSRTLFDIIKFGIQIRIGFQQFLLVIQHFCRSGQFVVFGIGFGFGNAEVIADFGFGALNSIHDLVDIGILVGIKQFLIQYMRKARLNQIGAARIFGIALIRILGGQSRHLAVVAFLHFDIESPRIFAEVGFLLVKLFLFFFLVLFQVFERLAVAAGVVTQFRHFVRVESADFVGGQVAADVFKLAEFQMP